MAVRFPFRSKQVRKKVSTRWWKGRKHTGRLNQECIHTSSLNFHRFKFSKNSLKFFNISYINERFINFTNLCIFEFLSQLLKIHFSKVRTLDQPWNHYEGKTFSWNTKARVWYSKPPINKPGKTEIHHIFQIPGLPIEKSQSETNKHWQIRLCHILGYPK